MINQYLNIVITPEENFDGMQFNQDLTDIKEIIITLPITKAPFNRGEDNDAKNIKNFSSLIKKCLTDTIESILIVNCWPINPASAFQDIDINFKAPKLRVFDFGFLGYNVLEELENGQNILDILGQGFLSGTKICWETRCYIGDHLYLEHAQKYKDMKFNVSWEGNDVQKFIKNLVKTKPKKRRVA